MKPIDPWRAIHIPPAKKGDIIDDAVWNAMVSTVNLAVTVLAQVAKTTDTLSDRVVELESEVAWLKENHGR